ncbi:MAG: hypothetical protein IKP39_01045 [Paludibacteraceae bacterium]|nr:hypothetical protein [Paludibacteraceae bacterium]
MKHINKILLLAWLGIALAGCNLFNKPTEFQLSDLQGLWQENKTMHYVRFTTENSEETGYLYGREWDEAEDIYEKDLLDFLAEYGIHGNGWFKYKFEKNGNLTEIHLMDNGGAEIPKIYVVTLLTDTDLSYYEKDHKSIKFTFTKVVETKK